MAEAADVIVSYIRYEEAGGAATMWKHAKCKGGADIILDH